MDEISLRQLWTRRDRLSQTPSGAYRKLAERIKHLASYQTVLQNGAALDEAALLLQLKQLDQSPSIFSLFSELNRATIWLKSISESLKHAEFRCVSSNQQQYKILDNVLNKVYMAKVQRYLAELDQSASVVNIALAQLYHAPSFTTLISKTQLIQQRFHQANRQHVIQWQEIIASCTAT
ncbi:DUF3080 family protein [Agarivorans sp. QJM3NY_29]|uniref:DUF3080 family protein n=1 Tax=unclassified Agarivorans TaxID=2636026 RepID=UPI003D7E29DE